MQITNRELNWKLYQEEYNDTGCVIIPNFLDADLAEDMYEYLTEHVPWNLYVGDFESSEQFCEELRQNRMVNWLELSEMSSAERSALIPRWREPHGGALSYAFNQYESLVEYWRAPNKLDNLMAAVSKPSYLSLWHGFRGLDRTVRVEMNASRYMPGHFLSAHADDSPPGEHRLAAHVIGLTKDWSDEWGGRLTFCDVNGTRISDRVPSFNTLALFSIPRMHYVSVVSEAATKPRYSLFGWLHAK
jgi:SM-20-related protein